MRTRIVTLALLAAALALGLFGVPLAIGLAHFTTLDEQSSLQRIATFTARSLQSKLSHDETPSDLPDARDDTRLALYDDEGDRMLGTGPESIADRMPKPKTPDIPRTDEDGDLEVIVPITDGRELLGVVRAATPMATVYRDLVPAWFGMAGLAALVLLAVWLIARRHAGRLAGPLEELSGNARRLGEGDFSVHSPAVGIREIDAVGQALNSTAARLDDLLARERAFTEDASHQLRTPLTGLRLRLEAALDAPDDDLRLAALDGIEAADRLERTIEELLLLARGGPGPRAEPLSVTALAEEIRSGWSQRFATHGRSLLVEVGPQLPVPLGSAAATRQVLAVLLDNAEVHGAGTVRVAIREANDAIAIDVSDEGAGLPAVGPLASSPIADRAGHGLGLALARRLAEAEGGRLVLTRPSPPVFTLLLPARWPLEHTAVAAGTEIEQHHTKGPFNRALASD